MQNRQQPTPAQMVDASHPSKFDASAFVPDPTRVNHIQTRHRDEGEREVYHVSPEMFAAVVRASGGKQPTYDKLIAEPAAKSRLTEADIPANIMEEIEDRIAAAGKTGEEAEDLRDALKLRYLRFANGYYNDPTLGHEQDDQTAVNSPQGIEPLTMQTIPVEVLADIEVRVKANDTEDTNLPNPWDGTQKALRLALKEEYLKAENARRASLTGKPTE